MRVREGEAVRVRVREGEAVRVRVREGGAVRVRVREGEAVRVRVREGGANRQLPPSAAPALGFSHQPEISEDYVYTSVYIIIHDKITNHNSLS